jgi:predicted O-methyltransferase YrrM
MNLQDALKSTSDHIWNSEEEVGELLATLIKMLRMTKVLEAGVFKGRTSSYMISALPEDGEYYGIDIKDQRTDEVKEYMSNHQFILGDSREVLKTLQRRYFDMIFIDSVHEADFLRVEFKEAERVVKQDGFIVLHDAYLPGVKEWIDYVKQFKWFEVINFNTCDSLGYNRGVAIIKCLCE